MKQPKQNGGAGFRDNPTLKVVMSDLEAIADVCNENKERDGAEGGLFRLIERVVEDDLSMLERLKTL